MVTDKVPSDPSSPPVSITEVIGNEEEQFLTSPSFPPYISSLQKTWLYLLRAFYLRCPACGISPIFPPFYQFNSISHWFVTLPGCPHCNIKYYREPGYFQIVTWILNIEGMIIFGVVGFILIDQIIQLSFFGLLFFNTILVFVINILTIRHAKAFFMALDHLIDPPYQPPKKR